MSEPKPLPCPFCGSTDVELKHISYGDHAVSCNATGCRINGPLFRIEHDAAYEEQHIGRTKALAAWNRRVATPAGPSEREALKEAMWQLLDDMGADGLCVCLAAKRQAVAAFRPFENDEWPLPDKRTPSGPSDTPEGGTDA